MYGCRFAGAPCASNANPSVAGFGWVYFTAIVTVLLVHNIVHSSFGRTLLAVREDEIAAEAMGVNTTRAKIISFVLSSTMATPQCVQRRSFSCRMACGSDPEPFCSIASEQLVQQ